MKTTGSDARAWSSPLGTLLSRSAVDRDYLTRARPGLFTELHREPGTRFLPLWAGRSLCAQDAAVALRLLSHAELLDAIEGSGALWPPDRAGQPDDPGYRFEAYLGRSLSTRSPEPVGTPIVAVELTESEAQALAPEAGWLGLRELAALLDDRDSGLFVEAVALANWHASHRFSPRTGERLVAEQGGWVLRAPGDSAEVFPRTDPAVIVAVVDERDRLLLGSNAMWQHDRYSLLAGFVEPGESLEAAVVREIHEESGIRVINPRYLGSQPWPFPASLMLGFHALADPGQEWELTPDGSEILDLRWFSREELRHSKDVVLPGPASIARAIIDDWLAAG